jgi:hypothetical protein
MELNKMKDKYIFHTTIDLGDGDFVKLREPTLQELNEVNNSGRNTETLSKLFSVCLVDHSFIDESGVRAAPDKVYAELKMSGSLFTELIAAWLEKIPFQHRLRKEPK